MNVHEKVGNTVIILCEEHLRPHRRTVDPEPVATLLLATRGSIKQADAQVAAGRLGEHISAVVTATSIQLNTTWSYDTPAAARKLAMTFIEELQKLYVARQAKDDESEFSARQHTTGGRDRHYQNAAPTRR